jgi:endoglucanase
MKKIISFLKTEKIRKSLLGLPLAVFIILAAALLPLAAGDQDAGWTLNDQEYFARPGLSVLVFHDIYPEGKQGGIEIIQHGERIAAVGDLRLRATPGQWGERPTVGPRSVDRNAGRVEVPLRFTKEGIGYKVRVEPCGEAVCVTVDLDRPLPVELAGRLVFNLELFPPAYFAKTYHLGLTQGVFPLQGNGPLQRDVSGNLQPVPLAAGTKLIAAPEDPLRRLEIEALNGELRLYDGRDTDTNGWFVVSSPVAAGAAGGAVRWRITPNSVAGWIRPPVVAFSQVGYHPDQDKRAVIELQPGRTDPGSATLLRIDPAAGFVPVLTKTLARWGRFLRYDYAIFDFTPVREPGLYALLYGDKRSEPFLIAADVYRQGVWQPTLETFLPVQMCHVRVIDRGRVWHGACHLDDALQPPAGLDLSYIEDYRQGSTTDTPFSGYEHIPGLDRGGWHDAGDYDLAAGAQSWVTLMLSLARENFGLASDQTAVDPERRLVDLHVPDGKADILQQVAHGVQNLLGGYHAAGHSFAGISDSSVEQYNCVGDASTMSDNRVYDPALGPDEVRCDRSGKKDERLAFTGRDTGLEYRVAAALAAASRVLAGFDDALAKECLATALKTWEFEQGHLPVRRPSAYVPERVDTQEVLASVELLLATRQPRFAKRLRDLLPVIAAQVGDVGWTAARALPLVNDRKFSRRLGEIMARYAAELNGKLALTPYGVPWEPQIWGVTWDIQDYAMQQYFLHRAYPKLFGRENVLRVLNYVLGCHPASNTSLVSGVGAHSLTVAYGTNLNEWSDIPGGGVSGPSLIRPDLPELKEPFPYLWQQAEYVIGGASTYLFLVLAAEDLLNPIHNK